LPYFVGSAGKSCKSMAFADKGKSYYRKKVPPTGVEAVAVVSTFVLKVFRFVYMLRSLFLSLACLY